MYSQHITLLTLSSISLFLTATYLKKARCSLFVLKVPLNHKQAISLVIVPVSCYTCTFHCLQLLRVCWCLITQETEMLADRLIQDQVKCAQQQEEICVLRQKIASSLKQTSSDSTSQVLCDILLWNGRVMSREVATANCTPSCADVSLTVVCVYVCVCVCFLCVAAFSWCDANVSAFVWWSQLIFCC